MRTLHQNFRWGLTGEQQSMLVQDGLVVARGTSLGGAEVASEIVDHEGRYLLPAFIDAHCHILPTGLDLQKLHLGSASTHEDVLNLVRQRHADQPEGWLLAVHYDQNRYDGMHLDRHQLDAISSERPILLRHVNGHASVVNSAALKLAGVHHETPDPEGGCYVRDASGRLTGVLLEHAHEHVSSYEPAPDLEQMVDAITRAADAMRALGIGCASDMMTGRFNLPMELEAYKIALDRGCAIDIRLYLQWKPTLGPKPMPTEELEAAKRPLEGTGRGRIAGIKIFADGAIGSATAAIYGRYSGESPSSLRVSRHGKPVSNDTREVDGQLIYTPERLRDMVLRAHEAGYSVATHTIGDYSTDLVLEAYEATGEAAKHRLEHAMLLSDEQIERIARAGCPVTFQPEFLMKFGVSYRRQLGPERAAKLKRARSLIDAGIPLSFNSDRPIVAGNPWDGIRTAENRPEGFDPTENCTRLEAILAYTAEASKVNGDGHSTGTLLPGTKADFQTLDADPLVRS